MCYARKHVRTEFCQRSIGAIRRSLTVLAFPHDKTKINTELTQRHRDLDILTSAALRAEVVKNMTVWSVQYTTESFLDGLHKYKGENTNFLMFCHI